MFDLTVEKHHCYFVDGLLTSNSTAFACLALNWQTGMTNDDWFNKNLPEPGNDLK